MTGTAEADRAARVVAAADVLAADLLAGGPPREALDVVRAHSWVDLYASDQLLADTEAVVETLADAALAADWRERVERERIRVEHPDGDHPGLASAYRAEAAHLLSLDPGLSSVDTNRSLRAQMQVSVRPPDAFARLFDPAALYESIEGDEYPGPDRAPRG
jgi:hypothetical protein